jgi:hypothetical protein
VAEEEEMVVVDWSELLSRLPRSAVLVGMTATLLSMRTALALPLDSSVSSGTSGC